MTKKVIIDTDPGIDDAMAIHFAFAHPEIEVVGLTTIFGNVAVERSNRNALALVEMGGCDCPVAGGRVLPLVGMPPTPPDFVHGTEGFGEVAPFSPTGKLTDQSAAEFICAQAEANPGEISLVALGPLTNLAKALDLNPDLPKLVRDVVVMGGAMDRSGNITPHAEANIYGDPEAADQTFAADWPLVLVGLDVTMEVICSREDFADLSKTSPDIGGFLAEAADYYIGFHLKQHGVDGCFLHDPSTLIALTNPEFFRMESHPLSVVLDGDERGRTVRAAEGSRPESQLCLGVDSAAVHGLFLDCLRPADQLRDDRQKG